MGQSSALPLSPQPSCKCEDVSSKSAFSGGNIACLPSKGTMPRPHSDLREDIAVEPMHEYHSHTHVPVVEVFDSSDAQDVECSFASRNVGEKATPEHLILPRHRVFAPHLQSRFEDFYQIDGLLGEGAYGNVYRAVVLSGYECGQTGGTGETRVDSPISKFVLQTGGDGDDSTETGIGESTVGSTVGSPMSSNGVCESAHENDLRPENPSIRMPIPSRAHTFADLSIRRVAVKCFILDQAPVEGEDEDSVRTRIANRRASFERERSLLASFEHPHIVKLYECFESDDRLWMVMELCRGGELYQTVASKVNKTRGGALEEGLGRTIFRQMLHAASYLHAKQVVHRDVKTENFLLLGEQGSANSDFVKLCDFGTAVRLNAEQPRAMGFMGTLSYVAPEIYEKKGATVLADAWSLGVVLYVILIGASPFRVAGINDRDEVVRKIIAGEFDQNRGAWKRLSRGARDLIKRFLVLDEVRRLTSAEAVRHPWIEPHSNKEGPALGLDPCRSWSPGLSPRRRLSPRATAEDSLFNYSEYAPAVLQAFQRFASLDAMQQLILVVCAQMTPESDLLNFCCKSLPWYELFFALDANEDGCLDYSEFAIGLSGLLGMGDKFSYGKLRKLMLSIDVDCSGTVDWVEWVAVALLSSQGDCIQPEPLRTAFRLLDRPSGDGVLGTADLLAVISSSGPAEVLANKFVQNALGHGACQSPLAFDDVQRLLAAAIENHPGVPGQRGFGAGSEVLGPSTRTYATNGCCFCCEGSQKSYRHIGAQRQ